MQRCLQLAELGSPNVAPNPMVGCVVVYNGIIIGEGFHQQYGGPHAEVQAIASVKDKSLLSQSTLYVSLEPCSHFGKTPPCANLILESKIPRVVCAMNDPNPTVAGNGIKLLREAGVEIILGVLEKEAISLNKSFVKFHTKKQPYVLLKWAETADGYIGRLPTEVNLTKQISGPLANTWVHKIRAESKGIVVGSNTIISDNPLLTNRLWSGNNPIRLIFDINSRINPNAKIFQDDVKTVLFGKASFQSKNLELMSIQSKEEGIPALFKWCFDNNCTQILVEGGRETLQHFIDSNNWDEAFTIKSDVRWQQGIPAPIMGLPTHKIFQLGQDSVFHYLNSAK